MSSTSWASAQRRSTGGSSHTDIPEAPRYVVESDDKRSARINMIAHLLSTVPYQAVGLPPLKLRPRPPSTCYQ
ncbi:hypothetical protein ACFYO0_40810 [Streptomyces sp. NPDC006365]|uniref:hypothetical protein n=1 Tax=Streptomyces sp. NPDC006365 TaxID=3364744 RepID=UPI00367DA3E0